MNGFVNRPPRARPPATIRPMHAELPDKPLRPARPSPLAAVLIVAALLVALATVGLAAWRAAGSGMIVAWTDAAAVAALGLGLAAALWALSGVLRTVERVRKDLEELAGAIGGLRVEMIRWPDGAETPSNPRSDQSETRRSGSGTIGHRSGPGGSSPPAGPSDASRTTEIIELLKDIRANTLLSEEERRAKAARVEQDELAAADRLVRAALPEGDFAAARRRLDELDARFPGRTSLASLRRAVEEAAAQRETADVAAAERRVDELLNISAWDKAEETCRDLAERYPKSAAAARLAARVEREFHIHDDEQRTRLHAEIQRLVSRRRWSEALSAAQTFIERYPHRPESGALTLQLDTLRNNADISTRQALEAEITELAKRGHYAEAEAMARRVIDQFPDSPQAEILRSQLERLHELATNPDAPPPRVRPFA